MNSQHVFHRTVLVPHDGKRLTIVYDFAAFTAASAQIVNIASGQDIDERESVEWLGSFLVSWDLREDDGYERPLTHETLMDIPSSLQIAIGKAVLRDTENVTSKTNPALARVEALKARRIANQKKKRK